MYIYVYMYMYMYIYIDTCICTFGLSYLYPFAVKCQPATP